MARKVLIQIRRGAETSIGTLAVGELGYCTDTQKLYIGTPGGNVLLVAAQATGDMLKSIYDTNNNGKVDAAEAADAVPWAGVTGKPTAYAPSAHTHNASELTAGTLAAARLPAATTSVQGAMSAADKTKLDGIAAGAQVNAVTSVAGRTGAVALTADDVAETTTNKVLTAAERTKLAGIATGANNYVHPSGDGNQHVPATGTGNSGRVLKAGATAGSAAWGIVDWSELSGRPAAFAPSAHDHLRVQKVDDRDRKPADTAKGFAEFVFTSLGGMTGVADSDYQDMMVLNMYSDSSGGKVNALVLDKSEMLIRHYQAAQGDTTWGTPRTIAYAEDVLARGPLTWNQLKGV